MPTRNVVLTERHETLIEDLVKADAIKTPAKCSARACASSSAEKQRKRRNSMPCARRRMPELSPLSADAFANSSAPDALKAYLRTIGDHGLAEPEGPT